MTTIGTIDKPTSYIDENGMKVTRIPCVYGKSVLERKKPDTRSKDEKCYSDRRLDEIFGSERKTCPECGKTFIISPEHLYKLKIKVPGSDKRLLKYYCSYRCWNEAKKKTGRW